MAQDLAHGRALPTSDKLRPPPRGGSIQLEVSSGDKLENRQCNQWLSYRIGVDDRVRRPQPGASIIGPPAPHVDHKLTVENDRAAGAEFAAIEVLAKDLTDGREPRVDVTVDFGATRRVRAQLTTAGSPAWIVPGAATVA